jgi:hypothetical protein
MRRREQLERRAWVEQKVEPLAHGSFFSARNRSMSLGALVACCMLPRAQFFASFRLCARYAWYDAALVSMFD